MDHLTDMPVCRYVTLIDARRRIGFHSSPGPLAPYPSSQGCVRLEPWAARLIHDNAVAGETEILVDGTWTPPPATSMTPPDASEATEPSGQ